MNTTYITESSSGGDLFDCVVEALRTDGYIVVDDVFTPAQLQSLFVDILESHSDVFHPAGIGREQQHQQNQIIRSDRIRWLDTDHQPIRFYLEWAEQLRLHLNKTLFLGLFDYESHYSHFPEKAFYKKHLDAFKGNANRRLSSILYLNSAWQPEHGGELVLYAADGSMILEKITPTFGKMVIFMSEEFPHEVLPTHCSRYSLTGWYRINNTTGLVLDPPK